MLGILLAARLIGPEATVAITTTSARMPSVITAALMPSEMPRLWAKRRRGVKTKNKRMASVTGIIKSRAVAMAAKSRIRKIPITAQLATGLGAPPVGRPTGKLCIGFAIGRYLFAIGRRILHRTVHETQCGAISC